MPPVEFGLFVVPTAEDPTRPLQQVQAAERLGLELVGIQDHPYQRRFLDTWTLIAWLAAHTSRIRLFPDVANLPLRPPAPFAKAVASLDVLSGGRVELGLGAGAFWDGVAGLGGPRRAPGESVDALEEAIEVIRLMWAGEPASFEGRFYSLEGAKPGPVPAHDVAIWIGAYRPRMLRLTGRVADGWLPSLPRLSPEDLPERVRLLEEGAEAAGRDAASVRRLANVTGVITDGPTEGFLRGPTDHWVEELQRLHRDFGFSAFVFSPDGDDPEQVERFASEVAPAVREAA